MNKFVGELLKSLTWVTFHRRAKCHLPVEHMKRGCCSRHVLTLTHGEYGGLWFGPEGSKGIDQVDVDLGSPSLNESVPVGVEYLAAELGCLGGEQAFHTQGVLINSSVM